MKLDDAFPSAYLKHADVTDRTLRLTITGYAMEDVGQGADKETKPVLSFRETPKRLVLNKTNAIAIAEVYGKDLDDWIGKPIVLYPDRTSFNGKIVDCLRVKALKDAVRPAAAAPQARVPHGEQSPPDDVPAPMDDDISL